MVWRSGPQAHTCGTSPEWLDIMDARVPEANVDICRLAQNSRSVTHHAASMTCTVETLEARLVRAVVGLVAGNGPAKSQDMRMTCSRAVAADGADIAKEQRRRFDSPECVRKRVKSKRKKLLSGLKSRKGRPRPQRPCL